MNSPNKFKRVSGPWGTPGGGYGGPGPGGPILQSGSGGSRGRPLPMSPFMPLGQNGGEAPSAIPGVNSQGAGRPMPSRPMPQGPQQGPGAGFGNYGPFAQNARLPWLQRGQSGGTPNMWA